MANNPTEQINEIETNDVIVFLLKKNLQIVYVSDNVKNVLGYSVAELNGTDFLDICYKEDKQKLKSKLEYVIKNGNDFKSWEVRKKNKNDEIIWVKESIQIRENDGKISEIKVCATDISNQKKIEQKLVESEKKYRNLVNNSRNAIVVHSKDKILFANKTAIKMAGGKQESDLVGKSIRQFIHPDSLEGIETRIKTMYRTGKTLGDIEAKFITLQGETIILQSIASPIEHDGEKAIQVSLRDITEESKAIESLKTRDKIFSALNFSTETFLRTLEWQANIQEVLKRLGEALDVSRCYIFQNHTNKNDEVLTKQRYEWINEDNISGLSDIFNEKISYKEYGLNRLLKILQGKKVYQGNVEDFPKEERKTFEQLNVKSLIIVPIFTIDNLWGFIGFDECRYKRIWSETEIEVLRTAGNTLGVAIKRKHFEEELLKAKLQAEESDKLKSQFLAQVSHEIRSPIHTILSFTNLIHDDIKDKINDEEKENFNIINSAGTRITRTIDLILNMSEIQTGTYDYTPRKIDIYSGILESLIQEFKKISEIRKISLKVNKTTNNTIRNVDVYTITQIFVNLLENAFKYTLEGLVELGIHLNENKQLEISVRDTGIGIANEYIPKLFKPFSQEEQGYTRTFEGNGLGLALVKNYCEMNKAQINVESEKGVGTIFRVIFQNN